MGRLECKVVEWNSFRFDNGARVNLYSLGNALEGGKAYLVGSYQKPMVDSNSLTTLL